ncbi:MAG: hypothetical protein ACJ71W_11355 [Terriglobales bacterium]
MANQVPGNSISFIRWRYLQRIAFERARRGLAVLALLLTVMNSGLAQEIDSSVLQSEAAAASKAQNAATAAPQAVLVQASDPQTVPAQTSSSQTAPAKTPQGSLPQSGLPQPQPASSVYVLPAGTKLPLGLLRPLRVKPGRDVYLQITFPVTVGSQMLIPPGTYIQGVLEKVIKKDRRSLQFAIASANLIFSNGYTVPISGTVTVGTTNAALTSPPGSSNGQSVPAMAAVGGVAPPPLPPLPSFNTMRNVMIGVGVASLVGTVVLIALAHNGDPEMEAGTPLEIILPAPVYLDATRVAAAIQQYDQQTSNAAPQIVKPPVKPKMCYDAGSPGMPDTVIPGSPGTPDTVIPGMNGAPDVVIPGTPRTPDTVIPGIRGTPSSTYPCP